MSYFRLNKSKVSIVLFLSVFFILRIENSNAFRSGTEAKMGRKKKKRRAQKALITNYHRELKVPKYCKAVDYDAYFTNTDDDYYEREYVKKWMKVCLRWYQSTTPTKAPAITKVPTITPAPTASPSFSPSSSPSSKPTTSGK